MGITLGKRTWRLALAGAFVACAGGLLAAGAARATPPHGVTSTRLAGPVEFDDIDARAHVGDYKARLKTDGESDAYFVYIQIAPGGDTGWHSHPGIVFAAVRSGTLTVYHDDFTSEDFPAGTGLVEQPGDVHIGVNHGDTDLELVVLFLVPRGAPTRIDEPAPKP